MKPRTNYHKPVLLEFAGVALVMGLGWAIGPEGRLEYTRLTSPLPKPRMPDEDFVAVMRMSGHSDFHRELSDANWTKLKAIYARNHHDSLCFGALRHLRTSFAHRDEAIAMLEGYLREGHEGGNLIATSALRSLDAQDWRVHADALRSSEDQETRELSRVAFGNRAKG